MQLTVVDATRNLIRLIIEVVKDMTSFIIILFLSCMGASLIFYMIRKYGKSPYQLTFITSIQHTFLLMLGDF